MKRCPECMRDYFDDSLFYCLDDGASLLDGPASFNAAKTEAFHYPQPTRDAPTVPTVIYEPPTSSAVRRLSSVAVLPFANLSGDATNEYFSDGLSEELLNVLSKIAGIRVAARTSAFSFKGKSSTVAEIGSILNVSSVLEGSIRFAGNRIRVNVQLEDAKNGYQLWSETYDRTLDDIFAVQDDIAQAVVEEIREHFLGDKIDAEEAKQIEAEVADAMKGRSADPEAQRLVLLGRHFLDRTNREDGLKAIAYFEEAVAIDPKFALGWAALSHALCVGAGKTWLPLDEAYDRARHAATEALAAEPELAEAYAQLGRIQAAYDLDLKSAAESYAKALSLAPTNPVVADGASILELKLGNVEKALSLSRSVLDQDPLSAAVWHNLGLISHAAGNLDYAANAFRKAIELSPNRLVSGAMLSVVLLDQGLEEEAKNQANSEPDDFWKTWALAIINFKAGRLEDFDLLREKLERSYVAGDAFQLAEVYAVSGEPDKAFSWLDRALGERDPGITHAKVSTHLRSLYGDARWDELTKKLGL
ncbi:MAG: tetratricopeptide repeat protein [Pyrinomonadaceae bacterium]